MPCPSPSVSGFTVTVSAFVEMDMPTTMAKMIMGDLMIMNDLETDSGVTSWSSFGGDSCGLQPEHSFRIVVSWHHRLRLAPAIQYIRPVVGCKSHPFHGHVLPPA